MMRRFIAAALFLCAATATAQPVPSLYVPLHPCRLYDSRDDTAGAFTAQSTRYLLVRGNCNVPDAANAVAVTALALNPAATGHVKIWESSLPQPEASSFNFRPFPGADSSYLLARLCYPLEECLGEDLSVYASQATDIIVDVVGYTVPMPIVDNYPPE